jgi:hypothetical protein
MQDRIRQLVASAALQEVAHKRYLKVSTSPLQSTHRRAGLHHASWHVAQPTSTESRVPRLILRIRQLLRHFNNSVVPTGQHTGNALQRLDPPQGRGGSLRKPLRPRDELLNSSTEPPSSAPHGSLLYPLHTPPALGTIAAQQASRNFGHLDSSLLNNPPDILCKTSRQHEEEVPIVDHVIFNEIPQLLKQAHLCRDVLVSQLGSMQRTMLACEGIAINCLFDHGGPTSRVCDSRTSLSLSNVSPAQTAAPAVFNGAQIVPFHACVQVSWEPQWRLFKLATDAFTESDLLQKDLQHGMRIHLSTAEHTRHRQGKHTVVVMNLCHRAQAACESLSSHITSCIQVPSHHRLHCL